MAKFMFTATYTTQGVAGLLEEGGSSRAEAVKDLVKSLGGKVEVFYFALGADDVHLIADLPDIESAAAIALTVGGSGAVDVRTTHLLTPKQVDKATKKSPAYRPPGGQTIPFKSGV